ERLFRGQADAFEKAQEICLPLKNGTVGVGGPGFVKLRADAQGWVQRSQGALRHETDLAAANAPHLALVEKRELLIFEADFAGDGTSAIAQQAQDCQREGALARAAFSHQ